MATAPTSITASPIPMEHLVDLDEFDLARYAVRKRIDREI